MNSWIKLRRTIDDIILFTGLSNYKLEDKFALLNSCYKNNLSSIFFRNNLSETFDSWLDICYFEPMKPPDITWDELLPSLLVYRLASESFSMNFYYSSVVLFSDWESLVTFWSFLLWWKEDRSSHQPTLFWPVLQLPISCSSWFVSLWRWIQIVSSSPSWCVYWKEEWPKSFY